MDATENGWARIYDRFQRIEERLDNLDGRDGAIKELSDQNIALQLAQARIAERDRWISVVLSIASSILTGLVVAWIKGR